MILRSFTLAALAMLGTLPGPGDDRGVPVPVGKAPALASRTCIPGRPRPCRPRSSRRPSTGAWRFCSPTRTRMDRGGHPVERRNSISRPASARIKRFVRPSRRCASRRSSKPVASPRLSGRPSSSGEAFLFRELPRVRRDNQMLIYNIWAHCYGIQALVHMDRRLPSDKERHERIVALIRGQYRSPAPLRIRRGRLGLL